jgi:hypothetical protein
MCRVSTRVYLSVCQSVSLSVLSVCLSVCLSVLSVSQSVSQSVLSVCLTRTPYVRAPPVSPLDSLLGSPGCGIPGPAPLPETFVREKLNPLPTTFATTGGALAVDVIVASWFVKSSDASTRRASSSCATNIGKLDVSSRLCGLTASNCVAIEPLTFCVSFSEPAPVGTALRSCWFI